MSRNDKIDMIYDTLVDFRSESRDRMGRIEEDLRDHIEGVKQNRARIEKLEEPGKALSMIKRWAVWVTAVGAAFAMITKYLEIL